MNTKHVGLWQKLEQFQIDAPEATLPFSARLARENHWNPAHTSRVIEEYKRFVFLAVTAGHPVSPSEDVDQAWHLHLTYSKNYWQVFCPLILGQPLHHQPTAGGSGEKAKFDTWYAQTLTSYERIFGEIPPRDIWPDPQTGRQEKHEFIRVDRTRHWVLRKPSLQLPARDRRWLGLGLFLVLLLGTGSMLSSRANVFDWRGKDFLAFYGPVLATCFVLAIWLRRALRKPSFGQPVELANFDPYAAAFLNGGKILAVNAAIANLARRNAVRVSGEKKTITSQMPKPHLENALETTIYDAADSGDGSTIADARLSAKPLVDRIAADLAARGLTLAEIPARQARIVPLLLMLAVLAIGAIKLVVGIARGKPILLLAALCATTFVISISLFGRRPLRSRYGDAVLKQLRARHAGGAHRLSQYASGLSAAEFVAIVGLFGMPALAGTEWHDLRKSLQPPPSASSGGSCGGGCGGGNGRSAAFIFMPLHCPNCRKPVYIRDLPTLHVEAA